jgi:hypothetical protein
MKIILYSIFICAGAFFALKEGPIAQFPLEHTLSHPKAFPVLQNASHLNDQWVLAPASPFSLTIKRPAPHSAQDEITLLGEPKWMNGELLSYRDQRGKRHGVWFTGGFGSGKSYLAINLLEVGEVRIFDKSPQMQTWRSMEWQVVSCATCSMSLQKNHSKIFVSGSRDSRSNIIFSRAKGNRAFPLSDQKEVIIDMVIVMDNQTDSLLDNMLESGLTAQQLGITVLRLNDLEPTVDLSQIMKIIIDSAKMSSDRPEFSALALQAA